MSDEEVARFVEMIAAPKLERIAGVEAETDVALRDRVLKVCARDDASIVETAVGERLDAIGYLYGVVRGGFR